MDLEEPTVHLFFQNIRSERVKKSKFNIFINTKKVSINDRSFLYGDGLFETILVRDGKIYYLKDHYSRLKKGSKLLEILVPDFKSTESSIKKCINKTKNCIVKIIISRGDNKFGYQIPNGIVPNIYINKIRLPKYINNSLKLGLSNYKFSQNNVLSSIKHNNRIEQSLIANQLSLSRKYDDLVVLDYKNNIVETLSSNIFFVKNSKNLVIYTPDLLNAGIHGIMRSNIISYLRNKKIKIIQKKIPIDTVDKYDFCFICNSIRGIRFVESINKKKYSISNVLYNILKDFIYD